MTTLLAGDTDSPKTQSISMNQFSPELPMVKMVFTVYKYLVVVLKIDPPRGEKGQGGYSETGTKV